MFVGTRPYGLTFFVLQRPRPKDIFASRVRTPSSILFIDYALSPRKCTPDENALLDSEWAPRIDDFNH